MKKLLVFDLDETIIHATEEPLERSENFRVAQYYVYCRPHLSELLRFCFDHFLVAVWTSASADYAAAIVANTISPIGTPEFVWDKDRCTYRYSHETRDYHWVKDLRKIKKKGYPLEHVLFVDDSPEKLERNYGNHIRVSEYAGEETDDELKRLMLYLPNLIDVENVRKIEKRDWRKRFAKQNKLGSHSRS